MSNLNPPSTEHSPATPQGTSALLRILVVTVILLAAGLATAPFERGASPPAVGDQLVAPAPAMIAAPATGSSVPAAIDVFTGREAATEPPAPTF